MDNKDSIILQENEEMTMTEKDINNIKSLIYTVRGKQVMIDSDVAMLYHYETKKLNQAVKRNIERFPEKFCFQLTKEESLNLKSQIVTSSLEIKSECGGRRKLPLVFTEQGIF